MNKIPMRVRFFAAEVEVIISGILWHLVRWDVEWESLSRAVDHQTKLDEVWNGT